MTFHCLKCGYLKYDREMSNEKNNVCIRCQKTLFFNKE